MTDVSKIILAVCLTFFATYLINLIIQSRANKRYKKDLDNIEINRSKVALSLLIFYAQSLKKFVGEDRIFIIENIDVSIFKNHFDVIYSNKKYKECFDTLREIHIDLISTKTKNEEIGNKINKLNTLEENLQDLLINTKVMQKKPPLTRRFPFKA